MTKNNGFSSTVFQKHSIFYVNILKAAYYTCMTVPLDLLDFLDRRILEVFALNSHIKID